MSETSVIDTSNFIEVQKLKAVIDGFSDRVNKVESSIDHLEKYKASGSDVKPNDKYDEAIRLLRQDMKHLMTVSTPAYMEQEMMELKDLIYRLQNELRAEVKKWQKFREDNYFQVVTFEEMLNTYKLSGVKLQEIADLLCTDLSNASRIMSGERKKDDFITYHKVKTYCLERMAIKQK